MSTRPDLIVFYDGSCGFCNRTVRFVIQNNPEKNIYFAALQSDFTRAIFKENNWPPVDMNTFYFYEHGQLYGRSTAALHLLKYLRKWYGFFRVFSIMPKGLRDGVYNVVAKRRHRLASGYCYVPTEEEQFRFLG